jgi:dihydrofolate reductase
MSQVVLDISMSLDGFVTAPNDARGRGLGDGGEVLHYWVFGGPWTYDNVPDAEATGVDRQVLDEAMQGGAGVAGRRMYDVSGGWGGSAPGGVPCIVVTHRVDEQPDPASGFEFVDGVEAAIDRTRQIAGDKQVHIGGGASIAQQALQAGLVDELHIHVRPSHPGRGPHPRAIIDSNLYMVLGTADQDGHPWVSPVYYAPTAYREFFWVSSPDTRHSRNIGVRRDVSIVISDSSVPIYTGKGVYMSAAAQELVGDERADASEIFSRRSLTHGGPEWTLEHVQSPAHL